jgi:phosphoribulokinase
MTHRHPVMAITGSSGAGTTSVTRIIEQIFRRESLSAAVIEGDSFHRYDRAGMHQAIAEAEAAGNPRFCHFSPEANLLTELEELFATYGESGRGRYRRYIHDDAEAAAHGRAVGSFGEWQELPSGTDLLYYEGLHGGYSDDRIDIARHTDLLIGVVPIINLEWIQKMHRDRSSRGHSHEEVVATILRRMPDYIEHICPQFSRTDVNFQRVPNVDTSNPFIARHIPTLDESTLVIRFRDPHGIDFSYLLAMLHDSYMSRPNTIVVPGGKMELAMQLIFTPMILRLMEHRRRAI